MTRWNTRSQIATEVFERMGFVPKLAAASEPSASLSADSDQIIKRGADHPAARLPGTGSGPSAPRSGMRGTPGVTAGALSPRTEEAPDGQPDTQHPAMSARLEPFVEPEPCLARVSVSLRTA